jgi:hypothetical protein
MQYWGYNWKTEMQAHHYDDIMQIDVLIFLNFFTGID